VKVSTRLSGEEGFIREGEGHGWQCGGAHDVGKGRENRFP
jgi:hypothetical protein